jgi:hypothetical protein
MPRMSPTEYEAAKRLAHAALDEEWDRTRREQLHGEVAISVTFQGGNPLDIVVSHERRIRRQAAERSY